MGRRADPGGSRDGAARAGTIYAGQPLHFLHPIGVGDTINITVTKKIGGTLLEGIFAREQFRD